MFKLLVSNTGFPQYRCYVDVTGIILCQTYKYLLHKCQTQAHILLRTTNSTSTYIYLLAVPFDLSQRRIVHQGQRDLGREGGAHGIEAGTPG